MGRCKVGAARAGERSDVVVWPIVAAIALSACGSGTRRPRPLRQTTPPTTGASGPEGQVVRQGRDRGTPIKVGVALVDFKQIEQYTDPIRTNAEQKQIYQIYIDNINAHGGINGRKIVPVYKYYSPLGTGRHPRAVHVVRPGRQRVRGGRDVRRLLG